MWLSERNTFKRGRSAVPIARARTLRCRFSRGVI
jgi:hypothetical protein